VCKKGITQFYLPPTHEPYLPLLPIRKAFGMVLPPFGWYTHCTCPRRDGQAELAWVAGYIPEIKPGHGHPSEY